MPSIRDEGKIKTMRIKHCRGILAGLQPVARRLCAKKGDLEVCVKRC